jgi:hypothetical protein
MQKCKYKKCRMKGMQNTIDVEGNVGALGK